MRIRSTKPEFWRSKTIASLTWEVRLVLKGLESYVDDNGVGKDDIALIAADVFPRDLSANPPETLARLTEAIHILISSGLVAQYEVDGEDLLYIDKWKDLQRIDKPAKGRFRRPDGTLEYVEEVDRESYRKPREDFRSPPEKVAPVTGEQGNRGTVEQEEPPRAKRSETGPPDGFEEFWETYSKKVGRAKAEVAYRNALRKPGVTPALLEATAAAYITWQITEGKHPAFTKDATTWLHGEHWRDERKDVQAPISNVQRHLQLAAELAERERGPRPPQPRQIGGGG